MIIARGESENKQWLILWLSAENVKRLTQGKPMCLKRETHGDGVPPGWEVLLVYGETEQAIKQELEKVGVIDADTKIEIDPRLEG